MPTDKYRLELHWGAIEYESDSIATLKGAYFSGPILSSAQKLNQKDTINIDLTPQHLVVFGGYYVLKLEWSQAEYSSSGKVILGDAKLFNENIKSFHKLQDSDFFIIDTEKHEHKTHALHFVYEAKVARKDKNPYTYTK